MMYYDFLEENILESIIESIYLSEELDDRVSNSNIFICPSNPTYIDHRVVVLTREGYPDYKIDLLKRNRTKVISRVKYDRDDVEFQPYIMRPNLGIMWNGRIVSEDMFLEGNIRPLFNEGTILHDPDSYTLYFPKIKNPSDKLIKDSEGNLTAIGWALHQVGYNTGIDTLFTDMDLVKAKKLLFKGV